ncbi:hypothetical protein [Haloarcula onubensis]|uniref:ParB/Sulfiredoxin domain-containing protein n=1 Tax=Haloarcula onubensis TaxID=2950539 RepID=A0ABU2FM27_9EURY|nr:hypothetical protein [Halomicroarcula sp. S3CR25-11]MDS0281798.1 hypothetical protein [Halomicroarcula sp. S3CR25-11]
MYRFDTLYRLIERAASGPVPLRRAFAESRLADLYWRVAPSVHRRRRHRSSGHVDPPVDPFELFEVDPADITRFTGRQFPVWADSWYDIGAVRGGEWDQRLVPPVEPSYAGPSPDLYLAETFTETPLHRALRRHFEAGVPWADLEFIQRVERAARTSDVEVWQDESTVAEIRRYCRDLDRLYESIRDRGFLSMRELNAREGRRMTFREVMEDEILVDVSRTGELLFVTGRHRLSMAKLLDLDSVPVGVVVRHREWHDETEPAVETPGERARDAPAESEAPLGEGLDVAW